MIDVSDDDVVARRDTLDGRFLLFTKTDRPDTHPLPWTGIMVDTGGDGFGLSLALNPTTRPDPWWAITLLSVAQARAQQEDARRMGPLIQDQLSHLGRALAHERSRVGQDAQPITFTAGHEPSPYAWTEVHRIPHRLPLSPDPLGKEDGITQEQLLLILDQTFADAKAPLHQRRLVTLIRDHVRTALDTERRRLQRLRP
ncbi:hypothetical protein [Magnetospirillum gryphiswaldense]|uniref:Uncharacterized protein n=1 Tax=Magnetospirillum gryphiswaldense TaxID=55518 RepID=A4TWM3_9PROT|nr:hypothetical protein [Magnetospirillum gryphiswaldense]AVM72540.1 hypothetical protein MSR1_00100 [Magnetospirillum gryphiswaldense MSR-1]AVM76443.1 hypothetical protein MSR1L_00100 [Magnetospirillum gryphiswaldense]CAM75030.1 hypothetical protein MGR_0746 [Magnetospirillum gryphiswaldense MSR-1]